MEIITNKYDLDKISPSMYKYFDQDTLFFDIECTGLSPKTAFVYLIGCACRNEKEITITQFFANDYSDEKELLNTFNNYIKGFKKLCGYNSTRFDEPFLLTRFKKYAIESSISSMYHRDMYLTVTKAKVLLDLANYKQKTIEVYLGLNRDDTYNGGELIPIYNEYSETKNEELKKLVLLHNFEDVKGMVYIIDILSYIDLLSSEIENLKFSCEGDSLIFSATSEISIPNEISKNRDYGIYLIKENIITGSLKVYEGTLNTYLEDYRNYYYLIDEDIIIPKVLGSSIDKNNRRNATRKDCKVPHTGKFIQIPEGLKSGGLIKTFKKDYEAHKTYVSIDEFSDQLLLKIIKYMLTH